MQSENVVGYVTFNTAANKKDISGVPFVNAGGTDFDIQNITLSNGSEGSDWIMVFNAATRSYETFNWFSDVYTDDTYSTSLGKAGWGDNYVVINKKLDPGQGFWIQTQNACAVTIPGQVVAATSNGFTTSANKKDIVACVFPTDLNIQDITLTNGTEGSDWIMVFNAATRSYETFNWFSDVYTDDTYSTSLGKAGWGDNYVVKEKTLDPAQGFWIQTQNAAEVKFPSPL